MHAAALVDLKIIPFPHIEIFRHRVAIISDDLKGIGVLRDESVATGSHEEGQDIGGFDGEPFPTHAGCVEVFL